MTWYTYEIAPIDMGWENLKSVHETLQDVVGRSSSMKLKNDIDATDMNDFIAKWESAKDAASDAGWEGDFRNEPVVFWVPCESEFECGFVIKQDNNGTTFVISPTSMTWFNTAS